MFPYICISQAIQILVGILNLGLGPILLNSTVGTLLYLGVPYWLGGVVSQKFLLKSCLHGTIVAWHTYVLF